MSNAKIIAKLVAAGHEDLAEQLLDQEAVAAGPYWENEVRKGLRAWWDDVFHSIRAKWESISFAKNHHGGFYTFTQMTGAINSIDEPFMISVSAEPNNGGQKLNLSALVIEGPKKGMRSPPKSIVGLRRFGRSIWIDPRSCHTDPTSEREHRQEGMGAGVS
jgi:hypothetical protein